MTLPSHAADRRLLPRRSGRRPADGDTSSRTQITRFGTAPESRPGDQVATPNGGSACGYQPDFALSALQETADVRVADPYIYAPALAGRLSAHAAMNDTLARLRRVQNSTL